MSVVDFREIIAEGRTLVESMNYRHANGVQLRVKSPRPGEKDVAIRFEGTKGWLGNEGWLGRLQADPESILQRRYTPETSKRPCLHIPIHLRWGTCLASPKNRSVATAGGIPAPELRIAGILPA